MLETDGDRHTSLVCARAGKTLPPLSINRTPPLHYFTHLPSPLLPNPFTHQLSLTLQYNYVTHPTTQAHTDCLYTHTKRDPHPPPNHYIRVPATLTPHYLALPIRLPYVRVLTYITTNCITKSD